MIFYGRDDAPDGVGTQADAPLRCINAGRNTPKPAAYSGETEEAGHQPFIR